MNPSKVDDLIGIISTCKICYRMYWTNGLCTHGKSGKTDTRSKEVPICRPIPSDSKKKAK